MESHNNYDLSSMESDSDYTLYTMRDVGHHDHSTPSKSNIAKLAKSRDVTSSSRRRHNMSANTQEPHHVDHHMNRQARPQRERHHRKHHVDPHEPMSTRHYHMEHDVDHQGRHRHEDPPRHTNDLHRHSSSSSRRRPERSASANDQEIGRAHV